MNENTFKMIEIKAAPDLGKWISEYPNLVVFPADNKMRFYPDSKYYKGKAPTYIKGDNRQFWNEFVEHPLCDHGKLEYELGTHFDLVLGGCIVCFLLDPKIRESVTDAMLLGRHLFYHMLKSELAHEPDVVQEVIQGSPLVADAKSPITLRMPVAVGFSTHGDNDGIIKYRNESDGFLRWTPHWQLCADSLINKLAEIAKHNIRFTNRKTQVMDLLTAYDSRLYSELIDNTGLTQKEYFDSNVLAFECFWKEARDSKIEPRKFQTELMTIDDIHDKYREMPAVRAYLQIPHESMHSPILANGKFEKCKSYLILGRDRFGWPVAVARKFGHGAVVFLPSCVDMEDLKSKLSSIKAAIPGARGWDLLEKLRKSPVSGTVQHAGGKQNNDINNFLEILVSESDGLRARKERPQKLLVKLNTRPAINVPIDKLIQFLVLWIHSVKGKGIMYCSDNNWNEYANKSGYSQIMALNATGNKECVIGGKFILPDKAPTASHIQYFKRDIISVAIFGKQPRKVKTKQGKEKQRDNAILLNEIFTKQDSYEEDIDYKVWRLQIKIKTPDEPIISAMERFMARDEKLGKYKDVLMTAFKDAIVSQQ